MARLTEAEFGEQLGSFAHTAFRLELQPAYQEPAERDTVAKFLGGTPEPPSDVASLCAWFNRISEATKQGKRVERVRVHNDPPTGYQRWERWIDPWNAQAGETIRYMTRQRAHDVGLLPAAGDTDWWLLDSCRLIVMRFDDRGHRVHNELVTDPTTVVQACAWRDLAVHHSVTGLTRNAAA